MRRRKNRQPGNSSHEEKKRGKKKWNEMKWKWWWSVCGLCFKKNWKRFLPSFPSVSSEKNSVHSKCISQFAISEARISPISHQKSCDIADDFNYCTDLDLRQSREYRAEQLINHHHSGKFVANVKSINDKMWFMQSNYLGTRWIFMSEVFEWNCRAKSMKNKKIMTGIDGRRCFNYFWNKIWSGENWGISWNVNTKGILSLINPLLSFQLRNHTTLPCARCAWMNFIFCSSFIGIGGARFLPIERVSITQHFNFITSAIQLNLAIYYVLVECFIFLLICSPVVVVVVVFIVLPSNRADRSHSSAGQNVPAR